MATRAPQAQLEAEQGRSAAAHTHTESHEPQARWTSAHALVADIARSPRMAAQRQAIRSTFGPPALWGGSTGLAQLETEASLQGKAATGSTTSQRMDSSGGDEEVPLQGRFAKDQQTPGTASSPQLQKRNGGIHVQRKVPGLPEAGYWVKNVIHESGKKGERLTELAKKANDDNLIIELDELSGFYKDSLEDLNYTDMDSVDDLFTALKRYAAIQRDDEGAHGAEKHGGSGDQFIIDRVNDPNEPNRASYLLIDDYLAWDTILKENHEDIFDSYKEGATETMDMLAGFNSDQPYATALAGNQFLTAADNTRSDNKIINVTWNNIPWRITLTTYGCRNGLSVDDEDDSMFKFRIGADVLGSRQLNARTVQKPAGRNAQESDIQAITKTPVAYTGSLAPQYSVDKSIKSTGNTPDGGDASLIWVTKY